MTPDVPAGALQEMTDNRLHYGDCDPMDDGVCDCGGPADVAAVLRFLADIRARLTEQLEDARRWAVHLEQENAAALALHQPCQTLGGETFYCHGCGCDSDWPCITARALGAEPAPQAGAT